MLRLRRLLPVVGIMLVVCSLTGPAAAEVQYLPVDGGRLCYEVAGAGPALVLIHDGLLHREVWDAQVPAFAEHLRVIRYDRRGYGLSDAPTAPYSSIDDLDALLEHLNVGSATLIGFSSGGGLAIDYTIAHPEKVEALVLTGAVVKGLGYSSHFVMRGYANHGPDVATTVQRWADDTYSVAPGNDAARARVRELLEANPHHFDHTKSLLQTPPDFIALHRLSEIGVPTLIINAEMDIPDVHAHGGAIEAGIRGARRIVIPGAGHMVCLEQPEAFNRSVLQFLASVNPGRRGVEKGFVEVNGAELYYEMMGDGPPLLLVHGFRHDHTTWDGIFERLAEHYRVLRYDLAGHGLSRRPAGTEVGFENLHALLEHFGISRAQFVAHGMGGRIALDLALEYPEMVDRLIVVSSGMAGFPFTSEVLAANDRAMIAAYRAGDIDLAADYFTRSWTDGPHREPGEVDPAVRNKCLSIVRATIEPGRRAGIAAMPDPPTIQRLDEITTPLLVIVGELDQPDLHAIADLLIEKVAGARRVTISGAAHMPHMERPDAFMDIAHGFLDPEAPRTGFVKIDGAELYYEIMGRGEPLVLLHGGGVDCRMWDDQFAPLAEHFRVIRYDTRSHGRSRMTDVSFSDVEDLAALLDGLEVEKAHLVGLSMGGRIAIDFALEHPERVGALVLAGPGLGGYELTGEGWLDNWRRMREAMAREDYDEAIEFMLRSWTDGPQRTPEEVDPAVRQRVRAMLAGMLRPDRTWYEGRALDPPAIGRLDQIGAPTLAIVGEIDQTDILEIVDMLCRTIEGAEKVVIPGAAHMVNMEQPEKFNRAVLEFLLGLERRKES